MNVNDFIKKLSTTPSAIEFNDAMTAISENYHYTPSRFCNGQINSTAITNEAGVNEGSCKLFAFAKLNNFTVNQTLACFGAYYRDDVLGKPEGSDHLNIRSFMLNGWDGVTFDAMPLQKIESAQ